MAWVDIANGEIGASVRTKLNALGTSNDTKAALTGANFTGPVIKPRYTVATLPATTVGACAAVTDALNPVFGSAVVGGGAITVPVFYNGAAWIVG